ncbi:hypothetical protein ACFQ3Z_24870 [Streptomyces nogalater]
MNRARKVPCPGRLLRTGRPAPGRLFPSHASTTAPGGLGDEHRRADQEGSLQTGEEQGRADALAGKPYADPPRDGSRGEQDQYANGYDWGYQQGRAQKLDLVVWQEGGVEDAPGGLGTTINVCVRTPNWSETVDAGEREHVFTAPTGFRWNGTVGAQYKRMDQTTGGSLPPSRPRSATTDARSPSPTTCT